MVQLFIFLWLTDGPVIYISLTYRWSSYLYFFDLQMVQNGTYLLGCGYAVCPNTRYKRFYVCNYAAG